MAATVEDFSTRDSFEILQKKINKDDFIIIGSGPVGFETALGLFRKISAEPASQSKIYIFEKRVIYSRNQILYMNTNYWNDLPYELKEYIFTQGGLCVLGTPFCVGSTEEEKRMMRSVNLIVQENGWPVYVKISILQNGFIDYFQRFGIHRDTGRRIVFIKTEAGQEHHFDCLDYYKSLNSNTIIVCDGAGGKISNEICGGKYQYKVSHAAVITFNFTLRPGISGEHLKQKTDFFNNIDRKYYKQNSIISYYTRNQDESFSGYVAIQLSKDTYNKLEELNKKYPKLSVLQHFTDAKSLFIETSLYTQFIDRENGIYNIIGEPEMSIFPITLSSSINFYKSFGDKYFFIVGDAAFTTHFFSGTGMNTGIASSILLMSLFTNLNEKREFLATLYTLIMHNMRNNLWKNIVPYFLYNFGAINHCNKLPTEQEKINCVYLETLSREYFSSLTEQGIELQKLVDRDLIPAFNMHLVLLNEMPIKFEQIKNGIIKSNTINPNNKYQVDETNILPFNITNEYNIPKPVIDISTGGNNNYYNKYLKYKNKYLKLKNQ